MTIKIVTDSTLTIEPEVKEALNITVVPLSILLDGHLYKDGDLSLTEFVEKMSAAKELPKTSQPPVGLFAEFYDELGKDGSEVLSIHLTKGLSGTVEAARQAAQITDTKVTVVDSDFIDQAMKFQVVKAAEMAQAGASMDEILAAIEKIRKNTELFIAVSTMENLVKGGRVSKMAGLVAGLLNIKVVLTMVDGVLSQVTKGRGNKVFAKWIDDLSTKLEGRKVKEIAISQADLGEYSSKVKERLQAYVERPITLLETSSTIATHAGPGAFAVLIEYEEEN
jgi:DegV family protein with EDD domain